DEGQVVGVAVGLLEFVLFPAVRLVEDGAEPLGLVELEPGDVAVENPFAVVQEGFFQGFGPFEEGMRGHAERETALRAARQMARCMLSGPEYLRIAFSSFLRGPLPFRTTNRTCIVAFQSHSGFHCPPIPHRSYPAGLPTKAI